MALARGIKANPSLTRMVKSKLAGQMWTVEESIWNWAAEALAVGWEKAETRSFAHKGKRLIPLRDGSQKKKRE